MKEKIARDEMVGQELEALSTWLPQVVEEEAQVLSAGLTLEKMLDVDLFSVELANY